MKMSNCIPKGMKKVLEEYVRSHYPDEFASIMTSAQTYYERFNKEFPDLGGKKNLLAGNREIFLTFIAAYEASGHRIGASSIDELVNMYYRKIRIVSRIVDFNKPWVAKLMYKIYIPYAKKVKKKKANGEWAAAWGISINPDNRTEGCCFHLLGCPIAEFAKSHGYDTLMPSICRIDHNSAEMMHAKLIRTHTVALGADSCDYWYVGDNSEIAKQYSDLKKI